MSRRKPAKTNVKPKKIIRKYLDDAKTRHNSTYDLAAELGCSQGLVFHWIHGITEVTVERALDLERVTGGYIKAERVSPLVKQIRRNSTAKNINLPAAANQ